MKSRNGFLFLSMTLAAMGESCEMFYAQFYLQFYLGFYLEFYLGFYLQFCLAAFVKKAICKQPSARIQSFARLRSRRDSSLSY